VGLRASRRPALRCLRCLQQLYQQIVNHHSEKCVPAVQAADAVSSNAAEGGASALAGAASNVMDLMMRLSTKARAVAANKVTLEAEQAKDALEREVQALERATTRPRTEASSAKNAEGMKVDKDMWDLGHHQWEATRVWNLRNIELGSDRLCCECTLAWFLKKKMSKKIIISPKKNVQKIIKSPNKQKIDAGASHP